MSIFKGKLKDQPGDFTKGLNDLNTIRNKIIDSIYLLGVLFSTISVFGALIRINYVGWENSYIFNILVFIVTSSVFFLRKILSLKYKAVIFLVFFFISGSFLNFSEGLISGSLQFIVVITIATLIFGWRIGVITIVLMFIVQITIGYCYFNRILVYEQDLNVYLLTPSIILVTIIGSLFSSSILVFAINKLYGWFILSLKEVSHKADELSVVNREMLFAKRKAEENDRLKSVFLANMSHEIRTPMNAIIGFSDLLSKKNLTDEKKNRYIKLIQERSYDLLGIIQDILDISKIEVGQMKLEETDIRISDLFSEINEYYKLKKGQDAEKEDIEIKYFLFNDINNLVITVDHLRLKQILNNLIDNAFKFTHNGTIEFGCEKHQENELLFYVKDSGIGIRPDKQDIIFDRFSQADDSLGKRQYGGTGLGLSIVKGILDLMQGQIWFSSELNVGTTFFFTLPLIKSKKEISSAKDTNKVLTWKWENRTLLIVEDDPSNNLYLKEIFSETNLKMLNAKIGTEALNLIETNPDIDLILMDIRLPDTNGLNLTRIIKEKTPGMVVIAHSAYAGSNDIVECMNAGCADFISKPAKAEHLLNIIGQYLKD